MRYSEADVLLSACHDLHVKIYMYTWQIGVSEARISVQERSALRNYSIELVWSFLELAPATFFEAAPLAYITSRKSQW